MQEDPKVTAWLREMAAKIRQWEYAESMDISLIWVSDSGHIYTRYRKTNSRYKDEFTKSEASNPCNMIIADLAEICKKHDLTFEEISFPGNHENRISCRGRLRFMPKKSKFYVSIDIPEVMAQ